jgi:hypothetical protein
MLDACLGNKWLRDWENLRALGSKPLRGHIGRKSSRKLGLKSFGGRENLRNLAGKSLRGQENSGEDQKSLLEAIWLEETRLKVTSRPPSSRKLGSASLRGRDNSRETSQRNCSGGLSQLHETLNHQLCSTSHRGWTSPVPQGYIITYIYIYIYICTHV